MASPTTSTVYNTKNYGSYGQYGTFYQYSLTSESNSTGSGIIAFEAFDAVAIENAVQQPGYAVSVTLDVTLESEDLSAHSVSLDAGYFYSAGYQSLVEADATNHTGPGNGTPAFVYDDLSGAGESVQTVAQHSFRADGGNDPPIRYSVSIDISSELQAAASAGRDLFLTLIDDGTGNFDSSAIDPATITVTRTVKPAIYGTVADQTVTAGGTDTPFSGVVLSDPSNSANAGDSLVIAILDPSGNGTDAYGTLKSGNGVALTKIGDGQYSLGPDTSLSALDTDLQNLQFTAGKTAGGSHAVFELDFSSSAGAATDDQGTSVDIAPACFCPGTNVLTPGGEVDIDALRIGDEVVTASGDTRPVRWLGRRGYTHRLALSNPAVWPVRVHAGALGEGLPRRDLLISGEHALFIDGLLVPARHLVNGVSVTRERPLGTVRYIHLELESHDVLLTEGAASESFVDDGNRGVFHNAAEWERLYPGRERVPAVFCAPRVESGPELEAIRRRLARPVAAAA